MEKLIITAAIVGGELTRNELPSLPLTPKEIAEEAFRSYEAGASIIHLHVRDKEGNPTQDKEVFRETICLIRDKCPVLTQVSTGGSVGMTLEERIQSLEADPDMATLTTGTCNFGSEVFSNPQNYIEAFAARMAEKGIEPEIECFEPGMIANALALLKRGLLKKPLHFDFVLGVNGAMSGEPKDLFHMVNSIPADSTWSAAGIGKHQTPLAVMAIILGGHARVGFEDNIYYRKGVLANSNAQQVERIARIARELDREIATPEEARKMLGL